MTYDLPNNFEIREAILEDAEAIASIHVRSWQIAYRGILEQNFLDNLNLEDNINRRKKGLSDGLGIHLVVTYNGTIIGFSDGNEARIEKFTQNGLKKLKGKIGEIKTLYIVQEYQARGIGKALFQEMIQRLKREGFCTIILWALADNVKAIKFYEAQGGVKIDEEYYIRGANKYLEFAYKFE
ncbi:MAG: family N-acetyltransferase [Rickettsiaceae bacterium]|jgi:ribosomal protein S18 acetylase RimI-like enzyme|nr:family N-acetyltransferase [Rickettsiaceae bacterium]